MTNTAPKPAPRPEPPKPAPKPVPPQPAPPAPHHYDGGYYYEDDDDDDDFVKGALTGAVLGYVINEVID